MDALRADDRDLRPHGITRARRPPLDARSGLWLRRLLCPTHSPITEIDLFDLAQVYGRRLTALVLDATHEHQKRSKKVLRRQADDMDEKEAAEEAKAKERETVAFGDDGEGRLVSVKCHMHKEKKGTGKLPDRSVN